MSEENEKAYREALSRLSEANEGQEIAVELSVQTQLRLKNLMKVMDWKMDAAVNAALSYFFSGQHKPDDLTLIDEDTEENVDVNHLSGSKKFRFDYTARNDSRLKRLRSGNEPSSEFDSLIISQALKLLHSKLIGDVLQ